MPSTPVSRPVPLHVSIAGAGPGGLCLAQGLRQAGIDCDVYERDAALSSRHQGYRIRIDADGQRALAQCLPAGLYALFRQSAIVSSGARFFDCDLAPVAGRVPERWRTSGDAAAPRAPAAEAAPVPELATNRQTLREILMCGLEDRVHFGVPLQRFAILNDETVRIDFADGAMRHSTLLAGADGVNSVVRKQLAPGADPAETGAVCVYGKSLATAALKADLGATLCEGTSVIFADGFTAIVDPMLFPEPLPSLAARLAPQCRLTPVDDYFYWAFIGPRASLGIAAGTAPDNLAAHIGAIVRTWHPQLRALFARADAESIAMLPVRSATPAIAHWQPGPVTLLGDAIHAMSPAAGAGANTALRDAAALAHACRPASLREGVARYERAMRDWAASAILASESGTRLLSGNTTLYH
ncbi:FAD-dependent oxidoreductase [Paraburkholderia ferrariae]|uniref:FAD-dependent oxidoreductase n=1 Tax=Paraburkholderia ferrariae TaxID=386056 RepID=UPI0005AA5365|nr:NAD(P)/FAD-dependent oxidoreductase [Paraburkholderia ferrariae]